MKLENVVRSDDIQSLLPYYLINFIKNQHTGTQHMGLELKQLDISIYL